MTTIGVMDHPAANTSFDCAYAASWHEEIRRAFDQRDVLPQAAREALARVLEHFLAAEAVDDAHLNEVRRTIALLTEPTDCARADAGASMQIYLSSSARRHGEIEKPLDAAALS